MTVFYAAWIIARLMEVVFTVASALIMRRACPRAFREDFFTVPWAVLVALVACLLSWWWWPGSMWRPVG